MMLDLIAENAPAGDVITIGETARNAKNLIITKCCGALEQTINVYEIGDAAGAYKRERGFAIAVCAGSTKHQDSRLWHGLMSNVTRRATNEAAAARPP